MHDYELRDKYPANLTQKIHHNAFALSLLNLVLGYSKIFHRESICAFHTQIFFMTPLFS